MIRVGKDIPSRSVNRAVEEAINLAEDCRSAVLNGFRIVQLDECMCTKKTWPKTDWSFKRQNTTTEWHQMNMQAIAIIAAVSREKGIELAMTFPKSVNVSKYKIFLENLCIANTF